MLPCRHVEIHTTCGKLRELVISGMRSLTCFIKLESATTFDFSLLTGGSFVKVNHFLYLYHRTHGRLSLDNDSIYPLCCLLRACTHIYSIFRPASSRPLNPLLVLCITNLVEICSRRTHENAAI